MLVLPLLLLATPVAVQRPAAESKLRLAQAAASKLLLPAALMLAAATAPQHLASDISWVL
jgi:hypothetical protein